MHRIDTDYVAVGMPSWMQIAAVEFAKIRTGIEGIDVVMLVIFRIVKNQSRSLVILSHPD